MKVPDYLIQLTAPDGVELTAVVNVLRVGNKLITAIKIHGPRSATAEDKEAVRFAVQKALESDGYSDVVFDRDAINLADARAFLGGGLG